MQSMEVESQIEINVKPQEKMDDIYDFIFSNTTKHKEEQAPNSSGCLQKSKPTAFPAELIPIKDKTNEPLHLPNKERTQNQNNNLNRTQFDCLLNLSHEERVNKFKFNLNSVQSGYLPLNYTNQGRTHNPTFNFTTQFGCLNINFPNQAQNHKLNLNSGQFGSHMRNGRNTNCVMQRTETPVKEINSGNIKKPLLSSKERIMFKKKCKRMNKNLSYNSAAFNNPASFSSYEWHINWTGKEYFPGQHSVSRKKKLCGKKCYQPKYQENVKSKGAKACEVPDLTICLQNCISKDSGKNYSDNLDASNGAGYSNLQRKSTDYRSIELKTDDDDDVTLLGEFPKTRNVLDEITLE